MKIVERDEARRLRKIDGLSLKNISKKLNVSKGSVSRWVNDISLTKEQMSKLDKYDARFIGSRINKEKHELIRSEFRKTGENEAKNKYWLHVAGCMLYWAEGFKKNNKNVVCFSNSDISMVKLFLKFLSECLSVNTEDIIFTINCYTDINSFDEIKKYWLNGLNLPESCLRKCTIDNRPKCTQRKINGTLPYGTCRIAVYNTSLLQRIYGSIQEYSKEFRISAGSSMVES